MTHESAPGRFEQLVESLTEFVSLAQPDGELVYVNPAYARLFGLAPAELLGRSLYDLVAPADREAVRALLAGVVATGVPQLSENRMLSVDGVERWVAWTNQTQLEGGLPLVHSVGRDVSAERQARRQLQRQSDILGAVAEAIPTTVVVVDGQGRYRFVNGAFEAYCGLSRGEIIGRTAMEVLGEAEVMRRRPFMLRAYAGETVSFTLDYPGPEGTRYLAMSCVPLRVEGVLDGFVGISQDVTAQRLEELRLTHLAQRDPLTGLLNRAGFEAEVERLVGIGEGAQLALLYVDLDHFKPVNDLHGHAVGDRVLQLFAQRLSAAVRDSDRIGRLGGDEFVVLLPGVPTLADAQRVADKVLLAAHQPFDVEGRPVQIGASIGVAYGLQPGHPWRDLLNRADALMYRAKAGGRGRQAGPQAEH